MVVYMTVPLAYLVLEIIEIFVKACTLLQVKP